ncbi:hypothetical protein HRG_007830 [Hirsutella rhossiliensis]|uniref:RAVE complex protein Rav1 C-terminal domain-containing protein n=1 Tax=Hirsutella rhossiliensis TaxID=111463 RepID=A0A9P8MSM1_9HYPO|nr:uncharacterized protein HRG_07830 [Hirsutella rhossiliensis]KAH0960677.1 hypothetical protein HRG_07830 [Hirsutella rhossiliensis]
MITVLPGRPQSRLQGLTTGYWNSCHHNAYISGSAFTVIQGLQTIIQTVYDDAEHQLEAVVLDEDSGKIATCTNAEVRIYQPVGYDDGSLKWVQQSRFDIPHPSSGNACSLSWGTSEELLVATGSLSLFNTKAKPVCSWDKTLPSPVRSAFISHDSSYIVSIGQFDRLPKVWRRLTYGGPDEVRFDVAYLKHPDVVTSVRWRRPFHPEQAAHNVLYTVCLDNFVRIWGSSDTADGRHWQIWGSVDLNTTFSDLSGSGLVCIIDGREFTASVERAVADNHSTDDVALDHIVAVANKNPEICMAIDGCGTMSAWALENLGMGSNESPRVFSIAQVKSKQFEDMRGFLRLHGSTHVQAQSYCDRANGKLRILLHAFDGRIGIYESNVADLFDPAINNRRLSLLAVWSGHSAPIEKMSVVPGTRHIHRICVLRNGNFVVFLCEDAVSLWDCRYRTASLLAQCPLQIAGTPLCLIKLPRPEARNTRTAHIATITSDRLGLVWKVDLPDSLENSGCVEGAAIREFCRFELGIAEDFKYVLPVDPAGSSPVMSGFLDIFARDVAISYTRTGRVDFWAVRVDPLRRGIDWLSTCYTETGISDPALASGSMLKKAALVNSARSQITIWDIGGSRLEFEEDYGPADSIRDLDWTSTPDGQSILAVGFQYRVVLLSQMRFDYLNKGPAWAPIREIGIRELTPHPIGDSTWLGDGHLVVGAGNQLLVYDRRAGSGESLMADIRLTNRKDGMWDLFEAVQKFNGPIPVFHPQFLSQCILAGKSSLVRLVLAALHKTLKYLIPGEPVDDYLGLNLEDFYMAFATQDQVLEKAAGSFLRDEQDDEEHDEVFSEQIAVSINEKLMRIGIPQLSGHEQIQLADMVECVAVVEMHRRSMDENGARFMLFCRQNALRKGRTSEMHLSWREINWAYHSGSQDLLVDFVSRQAHGEMLWEHARESGIFMWLSDINAVKSQFEAIAKNLYTNGDVKNPVNCSLFYVALRKKTVLQGLWRTASGNKEQTATQRLLANDFEDPKWKRAALKNAYALLSKRRFEYAAAFFLLAGHLEDAVEVCLRQLHDMQLAIAVARVYEGDGGPVLQKILRDEVLPLAAQEGNRWLASWAFWTLGRKDMAVRALVMPVYALLETPCSPDIKSRLFLTDDPALVVLYSQLRQRTLQTLRGASKVTPKVEWEFVLHSAKLYDRMGCDLLGLDLVRNWEFQQPAVAGFGGEVNPLKLLRRRSSLVVDDLPSMHRGLEMQTPKDGTKTSASLAAAEPGFHEPDATALLDSFGL